MQSFLWLRVERLVVAGVEVPIGAQWFSEAGVLFGEECECKSRSFVFFVADCWCSDCESELLFGVVRERERRVFVFVAGVWLYCEPGLFFGAVRDRESRACVFVAVFQWY